MKKTLVVNLFAGPGTGKSTTMAGVFSELKWNGINAEIAPEYAKELVWEDRGKTLSDQIYVFGKQNHQISRLQGEVDVVITDSPIVLSLIYKPTDMTESFEKFAVDVFKQQNSLNIFLKRFKKYEPKGRLQTEEEAKKKDDEIKKLLDDQEIQYIEFDSTRENVINIASLIISLLKNQ